MKDRSERDDTDKKRIRRQKKAQYRKVENIKKKAESRVQKINPGLGNKRAEQRSIEAIKQAVVNEGKVIKPTKVVNAVVIHVARQSVPCSVGSTLVYAALAYIAL